MAVTKRVEGNLNITISDGFDVQPASAGSSTASAPAFPQSISVSITNRLSGISASLSGGNVTMGGPGLSLSFPFAHMENVGEIIDQISSAINLATSPNAK